MNPFKPDTGKKLERDLDAARSSRDKLTERLKLAEVAVAESRTAAQRLAREGADDAALDVAEAALRSSQDRHTTLAAALVETEQQVAVLECACSDLADKKLRAETAAAIEKLVVEVADTAAAFDTGAAKLADCTSRAAAIVNDAKGLEIFATRARAEVATAVEMVSALLRSHASGVLGGTAPAALPTPELPAPAKPRPKPVPTRSVYTLEQLKWTEAGVVNTLGKHMVGLLPIPMANLAIERGLAEDAGSHRAQTLIAAFGASYTPADAKACYDLDADGAAPVKSPGRSVRYSGSLETLPRFGVEHSARAITGTIPTSRIDAEPSK